MEQRLVAGAEVKVWPLDDPQEGERYAKQEAFDPPPEPLQVQLYWPSLPRVSVQEGDPAEQRVPEGWEEYVPPWGGEPQEPLTTGLMTVRELEQEGLTVWEPEVTVTDAVLVPAVA